MNPLLKTLVVKIFLTQVLFLAGMMFITPLTFVGLNQFNPLEALLVVTLALGGTAIFWLLLLWLWAGEVAWTRRRKLAAGLCLGAALALMLGGLVADSEVAICLPIHAMLAMLATWLPGPGQPAARIIENAPPRPRLFTQDVGRTLLCSLLWAPLIHLWLLMEDTYETGDQDATLLAVVAAVAAWTLLWRRRVRWTPRRVTGTLTTLAAALGVEAAVAWAVSGNLQEWDIPGFIAGTLAIAVVASVMRPHPIKMVVKPED